MTFMVISGALLFFENLRIYDIPLIAVTIAFHYGLHEVNNTANIDGRLFVWAELCGGSILNACFCTSGLTQEQWMVKAWVVLDWVTLLSALVFVAVIVAGWRGVTLRDRLPIGT